MNMKPHRLQILLASALVGIGLTLPPAARAHCDTIDGPVVKAAELALEKADVTPVLKWVKKDAEAEIKAAFARTLAVRVKGPEACALADQFFFETLVRIHRAGEGAPFTGLKRAGTQPDPAVESADKALDSGDIEPVVKLVTSQVAEGIRRRFAEVREKKEHAEHNVDAGRTFVAAYVEYVHYVEGLHQASRKASLHHEEGPGAEPSKEAHQEQAARHQH